MELKPCPRCGKQPQIAVLSDVTIYCGRCLDIPMAYGSDMGSAVDEWNDCASERNLFDDA